MVNNRLQFSYHRFCKIVDIVVDKMQDSGGDKNINKFDLTTKVALSKDNKGGTTATLHPQFRTMQPMRVVTAGAQIIQTQLVPQVQTMIKQGNFTRYF